MIHIGVCYGHNATVAVIRDGVLVFCQSEERLNRIKNSTGFPALTLEHVYKHVVDREEVRSATLFQKSVFGYLHLKHQGFRSYQYGDYLDASLIRKGFRERLLKTRFGWQIKKMRINARERNRRFKEEAHEYFSRSLGLSPVQVNYIDHHLSHAYSTLPGIQSWGKALIFTLDAVGDWTCATVNRYEDGALQVLSTTEHDNSLGYYYASTTSILGMKAGEHEFKVMGLAPYANRNYFEPILKSLESLIKVTDDGRWASEVNPVRLREELERIYRYRRFDNIAGAIQQLTEELILKWVHYWIERTGINDIAVSGGVFMNVKACQRLAESKTVGRLFIMPSAADESTAIGAAVWGNITNDPHSTLAPLQDLYLGMEFSDSAIEEAIRETGASGRYDINIPENINKEIGRLIAENEVVARCSGRMEFGARALGNRSILANPSYMQNLTFINDAIKSRDFWMPFTPSILEEDMPRYIVNHDRIFAPYMCITFDTTAEARKDLIAAIHPRDFTARPQCVKEDWNPDYYEIISTFKKLTGVGGVLNTSFNLHGEPNVCSPTDAIQTVDRSGLRHLAMGKFRLTKKD